MDSRETGYVALEGQIVGGGPRGNRVGSLGVFLDHSPADFGLAPHQTSWGGSLRTGLSEALVTDLDDNTYDLSWLRALPADAERAIVQLRGLLEDERDPIDRHYMLCELEERLYRCRSIRASALEELDLVAEQHHAEMASIRPALLEKFGIVPVIGMYRQASIRCQKAKRWDSAREWAQRGLDVYGDRGARPDPVDDLHRRVAFATAKIEEAARPSERKPHAVSVHAVSVAASPREPKIETLVCTSCGSSFERERTRGRKPKICPACRGLSASVASD
jgi:hypothetical protein